MTRSCRIGIRMNCGWGYRKNSETVKISGGCEDQGESRNESGKRVDEPYMCEYDGGGSGRQKWLGLKKT